MKYISTCIEIHIILYTYPSESMMSIGVYMSRMLQVTLSFHGNGEHLL